MAHVDTVIVGLESCLKKDCDSCPYEKNGGCDGTAILKDAIEHLEASKSELLFPEDLLGCDFAYVEYTPDMLMKNHIEPCVVRGLKLKEKKIVLSLKDGDHFTYDIDFDAKKYNIKWRCWRTRPTPWQQAMNPWLKERKIL